MTRHRKEEINKETKEGNIKRTLDLALANLEIVIFSLDRTTLEILKPKLEQNHYELINIRTMMDALST